ncbi:hypothetical protein LJC32_05705 [Oscillospiraceae bacterium OttesenSCG-928-F05]|nr:hypothetical protein [Oscillospiraceae bacterium OttesenSCG-928-F05]
MSSKAQKKMNRRDEGTTNKILAIFSFAFLLIMGLMFSYKLVSNTGTMFTFITVAWVVAALSVCGVAAGIIWGVYCLKNDIDRRDRVLNGLNISAASAILAVCAAVAAHYGTVGVRVLYVFVPVVAVLLLVHMIYTNDFFFIAVTAAAGGFYMWYMSVAFTPGGIVWAPEGANLFSGRVILSVVLILLLAALAGAVYALKQRGGSIKLGGKTINLLHAGSNYGLIYLTIGVTAAAVAAAALFGATFAYYLIFVMFAYLFVMAVYYTIKLM